MTFEPRPLSSPPRLIVTGGAGFIGSYVVEECLRRGAVVRVIDDFRKDGGRTVAGAEYVRQDLTDEAATRDAFAGFDACVNLAALIGGIGYFHRYPADILGENARIGVSTLKAALAARMNRVITFSSSMVFEMAATFPSREEDLPRTPPPITAYGFSKLFAERLAEAYHDQHGLPFVIVRPFNAYGCFEAPAEEPGIAHVIPDIIKKLLDRGETLELLGDGQQSRCFTHADDIARAVWVCLTHPGAPGNDFNVSSPHEMTMIELAHVLMRLMGRTDVRIVHGAPFPHDIRRRVPDVSKARELLSWTATEELEKRLPEVIAWIAMNRPTTSPS